MKKCPNLLSGVPKNRKIRYRDRYWDPGMGKIRFRYRYQALWYRDSGPIPIVSPTPDAYKPHSSNIIFWMVKKSTSTPALSSKQKKNNHRMFHSQGLAILSESRYQSEWQGSAILSESVRNRDTKRPGSGIGIEFCTSLGLSIGLCIEFFYFWVPHSINWDISSYFAL